MRIFSAETDTAETSATVSPAHLTQGLGGRGLENSSYVENVCVVNVKEVKCSIFDKTFEKRLINLMYGMASQLVIYSAHVILLVLVWLLAYTEVVPILSYLPECAHNLVYYAPLIAVFFLAIYAAFNVIYGVATFNDCAEAKSELLSEIKEAREELKRKRIIE